MVWSDQSQFPFFVIDNNGNVILTIDENGLHLVGPAGRIDGLVTGLYPAFEFTNANTSTTGDISYIPGGSGSAMRFSVLDSGGHPVGQYYIDDQGNGFLYTTQDLVIQSDTSVQIHQTPNGPTVYYGAAAVQFKATPNLSLWPEYNIGQNAFIMNGSGPGVGWTAVTFQNSWHDLGSPYSTAAFGLAITGNVRLRGVVVGGTKTDGTVICQLPVGFRPAFDKIIPVGTGTSGAILPTIRIRASTGNIECWGQSASTNGTHSWDNIEFERL